MQRYTFYFKIQKLFTHLFNYYFLTLDSENMDKLLDNGESLPLAESFYTIQGEGYNTGKAAFFIRLAGCSVGCSWCDAKQTWNPLEYPPVGVDKIVEDVLKTPAKYVVITGGEPLRYMLDTLCGKLKEHGLELFLETSGTERLSGIFDWICLSPKRKKAPRKDICSQADEIKVVIENEGDFEWAEENRKQVREGCKLYLQPEWSRSTEMLPKIIEYVKSHPEWEISLQTHKFMSIP